VKDDPVENQTLKIFNVCDLEIWGVWPEFDAHAPQLLSESDDGLIALPCCFVIISAEFARKSNQDGKPSRSEKKIIKWRECK